MARGRPKAKGRFDSHEELMEQILFLYYQTSCNQNQVANNMGVTGPTVANILKKYKPAPSGQQLRSEHNGSNNEL